MMSSDTPVTVALFGATGETGRRVCMQALDRGVSVRACCVRSPDKLAGLLGDKYKSHDRLTILKGDLSSADDVAAGVEGAQLVMCHVGGPTKPSEYKPPDMMLAFVKRLVPAMRAAEVARLLYQAGAFSPAPGKDLECMMSCMSCLFAPMMGIGPMVKDNTAVIEYLASECSDLDWTVTRPARLTAGKGTKDELVAGDAGTALPFDDLARFSLDVALSGEHVREAVAPTRKALAEQQNMA